MSLPSMALSSFLCFLAVNSNGDCFFLQEPWATSVGETSSPAECLDKRKLSDDWMKQSYHCRKIRRLQRDTVSLDLQVMVLQQEMTRLYADQAEVAEMISDLKVCLPSSQVTFALFFSYLSFMCVIHNMSIYYCRSSFLDKTQISFLWN